MKLAVEACLVAIAVLSCTSRATGEPPLADAEEAAAVKISALPRIERAWSAAGLQVPRGQRQRYAPVAGGALFAWSGSAAGAGGQLVAVDLATGRERWRAPHPRGDLPLVEPGPRVILLNHPDGETTALEPGTGRLLWTTQVCPFFDVPRDDGAVGFVRCKGTPKVTRRPDGPGWTEQRIYLLAFDLTDGHELWRRDTRSSSDGRASMEVGNVAVGARHVFMHPDRALLVIDRLTGQPTREIALPAGLGHVLDVETGGRDVVIAAGAAEPRQPSQLAAIDTSEGRVRWSRPYPVIQSGDDHGVAVQGTRLLAPSATEITEIDLVTGRVAFTHAFPRIAEIPHPLARRPLGGRLIVLTDQTRETMPAVVVRWDERGAAPTVAVVPSTAQTGNAGLVTAADDVIVVDGGDRLDGYRVLQTGPSEETLGPIQRVAAILDRASSNPNYTRDSIAHNRPLYEELRSIAGYERALRALAAAPHPTRRDRAVDAIVALGLPGVADLLLDEIVHAPPPPPLLSVQEQLEVRAMKRVDSASYAYRLSFWRRAEHVQMLAAMDDAKAATRLGPVLLERSTPEGLGWWDANMWGDGGRKAWDGATRREQQAHGQSPGSEGALFSESLPAMVGRPEAHAALYRLLARLGRAEDLARLETLHETTARTGGWAAICDADDAITAVGPERSWVDPWGLCRGVDVAVGARVYRVTQARSFLWLRRRRADGSFGPPAWAGDAGGDQCNDRRVLQQARVRGGRIQVKVNIYSQFTGAINPKAVFSDADGDGLTDLTEAAFGTDLGRPDTDGDGVPDGRDPAPLAGAGPRDDAGAAAAEMLRYAALFLVGGPVAVRAGRADWAETPNAAALTLHLARETVTDDQVCGLDAGRGSDGGDGTRGGRAPFPTVRIDSLQVEGARARGSVRWVAHAERHAQDLVLARGRGGWRVVDAPVTKNQR